MTNLSEDIQCVSSDTRPPMLDRTDFASWQQRIRLYCREGDEGALHLGPERPRVYSDLSPKDKDRFRINNRRPNFTEHYNSQSSTNPSSTNVPPHLADNSQLDSGI
ncbi:hypothetical protein Tco_1224666, partial [Tanacetum coccineum]